MLVHLIATLARLMGPSGLPSVVAEPLLVKHQLLVLNRSRHRSPTLRASDRILAGMCALLMRPARVIRSAIMLSVDDSRLPSGAAHPEVPLAIFNRAPSHRTTGPPRGASPGPLAWLTSGDPSAPHRSLAS